MKPDKDPVVIDLTHRRKAAEAARKAAAKSARHGRASGSEPVLGRRRGAGAILLVVAAVLALLWLAPLLF